MRGFPVRKYTHSKENFMENKLCYYKIFAKCITFWEISEWCKNPSFLHKVTCIRSDHIGQLLTFTFMALNSRWLCLNQGIYNNYVTKVCLITINIQWLCGVWRYTWGHKNIWFTTSGVVVQTYRTELILLYLILRLIINIIDRLFLNSI